MTALNIYDDSNQRLLNHFTGICSGQIFTIITFNDHGYTPESVIPVHLFRFFIGYWKKTGLDFYPAPLF
jgi:hypothetical protein